MQGLQLGIKKGACLFKMTDCDRTVTLSVLQYGEHGMTGGITGPQAQHVLQEQNRRRATVFVLDLDCALSAGR